MNFFFAAIKKNKQIMCLINEVLKSIRDSDFCFVQHIMSNTSCQILHTYII